MKGSRTLSTETLDEIIRRIVEVAKPDKIILFGSAARGEMGPNSDLDFLVIKSGEFHRGRLTEEIYMNFMNLRNVRPGVDVVVVTTTDIENYANNPALVIRQALAEGKVVYAASKKGSSRQPERVAEEGEE